MSKCHMGKKLLVRKRHVVQEKLGLESTMNGLRKPFRKKNPIQKIKKKTVQIHSDQNHCSNLTSKIMKMCEQILKKDSTPIQFKFFEL